MDLNNYFLTVFLGVPPEVNVQDFNNAPLNKMIFVASISPSNAPNIGSVTYRGYLLAYSYNNYKIQIYMDSQVKLTHFRAGSSAVWGNWERVSTDMPSFYKNYNSLAELKAALAAI